MDNQQVIIGRVSTVYGVKGWVKIYSHTDPKENIFHYFPWYIRKKGQWQLVDVDGTKVNGKHLIAHLKGCDDREIARQYTDCDIATLKEQLPQLEQGEYYWSDLLGLSVLTVEGLQLGKVQKLLETGANDVLVVRATENSIDDRERLIPYLPEQVICSVDLKDKQIIVDWDAEF